MDKSKLRSTLIKLMLGCLVLAAGVAIATILIGTFNDTTGKALGTVFVALLHIAIVFGLVSLTSSKAEVSPKSTDFVVNSSIVIAVLSFFTSVFAIWGALGGDIALKLYATYVIALFVLLHFKTLLDMGIVYPKLKPYISANYLFIGIVAGMLLGLVYVTDPSSLAQGFYGRLLAASAIVDLTLSVIVAVMHRLYIQQHPEIAASQPARAHGSARPVLVILLFFFVIVPLLQVLVGAVLWFWQ